MAVIHWSGAIIGLVIAIILILRKVNPVYALFGGAVIGGLIGGASLANTAQAIIEGTNSVMGAVVRVIAAGVLAGVLIESGAAEKIAETIVEKLGEKKVLLAIALSSMIITAVGVFIPVTVIIVAPIALPVAKKVGITKSSILLAMIGGGKAGNIISPNPNTIAVAKGFNVELAQVMIGAFIPAVIGLIVTYFVATLISKKGEMIKESEIPVRVDNKVKPSFGKAMVAPIVAVILLALNPIANMLHLKFLATIQIDAMYILPIAGLIGLFAMGQRSKILEYTTSGLNRMTPTVMILIGAGAIAGIISKSNLSDAVVYCIQQTGISGVFLAPISGILMAAATASTSTGAIVATGTFAKAILAVGVAPLSAAIMINTGAVVIDHLPHGNFFHASADAVKMNIKERMKLMPYESIVGGSMVIVSIIIYGFIK
ncbi:GntP family permease [Clostridium beijerinckii]|jgi:H+/gluconate symporter and related permeases|uniref:GntP family permease n=2 Tax=Clostridium beijerinckii TaxID=1520 RepID=A0AAE2UXQ9_CLOBE|nr:GntP family permease [Clostridium beijerinckii]ABR36589.1 Gluconate transporter [Clostridium beijerinckii NCIMB 8052]AIU02347.1 gluconate transporter [Clostridium beijerinckii ATCC 35702]MBF7808765.1 GntP family permease [Clostridium beijerinckii]NRT22342.1 GntP family gluconate:H+ symporter [Clostridium beijerinckii]NRT65145.1 GntP family gluconate:H+ symporter [Clostridium beijerinckii]